MTLDLNFRYADGYSLREIKAANAAFKPMSAADRYRLVKAAKCPTPNLKPKNAFELPTQAPDDLILPPAIEPVTPEGQPAARTVIQYRAWADEYRIRTKVETTVGTRPPEQNGPRITHTLTPRAARKIAESCAYVASKHGGYSTFLTLTFSEQQRWRLHVPSGNYCDLTTREICKPGTIQNEVSRFCEGLTKMWERGWHAEFTINGRRIACLDTFRINYGERMQCINSQGEAEYIAQGEGPHLGPLYYCWVAEVPDNENGEPNPHVHLLLRWQVPFGMFGAWAKRIEQLWGCGFAHLEKIKDGDAAAAYMMKAAGYLCKAQGKDDQGPIRGNRYGISEAARAPDWETLSESQLHVMGRLIADVHDHITHKYGEQYQQRKRLRENLDAAPKHSKVRHIIGKQLERVRNQIKQIPIVASKYQIILKGKQAFDTFILWARTPARWGAELCEWLPEKGEHEEWRPGQRPDSHWLARFFKNLYWRRSLRHMTPSGWEDIEFMQCIEDYEAWSQADAELCQ